MDTSVKKEILSWVKSLIFAFSIVFVCYQFLFVPIKVQGESMMPTFEDQDRIIVSKVSSINRFDMVVFNAPDADEKYVKRVIGLPGDKIEMIDDVLYVNGEALAEPYVTYIEGDPITDRITENFSLLQLTGVDRVPADTLFVLGDHRLKSNDSRRFGYIKEKDIIGVVKLRYFPFTEIGIPK